MEVGLAGVEQGLDPFLRSEKFQAPEQTQGRDFAFAAQATERLIESDRNAIRGSRADIDQRDVEESLLEPEIDNDLGEG